MAQPRAYSQTTTFNDFTVTNPSDPHSGSSIDTELAELKQNTDDLNTNIALLQRDDGKIKNETIHKDSFDQDALALIGASGSGFVPQGDWTNLKTTVAITTWATDGGSPAANIMTKVGHGLTDTTVVRLTTTVTLPTGFVSTSDYFVVSATADTFKLSGTSGGDPIAFTDVGSGTHSYSFPNTYVSGNIVNNNDATYLTVATSHTTGSSFAGDKALGHWTLIANSAIETSAASVDVITSIASQVLFPTSYTYLAPKDIQVYVNGLLISPSLYTVSNTGATSKDITFTTAPATGATVIIWGATVIAEAAKAAAKVFRDTAGNHSTTASRWANLTTASVTDADTSVDSTKYSAKAYAIGGIGVTGVTGKGAAKDWAIGGGGVVSVTADGAEYSAKKYAEDAVDTETAVISVANAMSNMHNNFDDRYLGALASSHTVAAASSITGAVWTRGSSLITSATQASGTITVGQVLTNDGSATGWPTTTTVRILAYDAPSSTITINQIFSDAQAGGETLTGVGYGVQGAYVVADLGPSTDNDGNTLLDGSLYYNTTTDALMVYDLGNTIWLYTKPTAAEQTNIDIVGGNLLFKEDLGLITGAVTSSSGNNIADVAGNETNINLVAGQIDPTNHISTLGPIASDITTVATAPIPANMAIIVGLGTDGSEVTAVAGKATEIGRLGTVDAVADLALVQVISS